MSRKGYNGGGEKMPAKVYMSKKELEDLIQVGKAAGTDTSQLEAKPVPSLEESWS